MNFIEIYVLLLAAIIVGVWLWARKIKKEVAEIESHIRTELSKIVFMHIEHHDNLVFAYNAFNEEFVCQGTDLNDLNIQFRKRFPTHRGVIVEPEENASVL